MNTHDKGMMEYEGYWCNDLRCGSGKSFDNEGNVIFEGNWYHRNHADDYDGNGSDLNIAVKHLKLNDNCILNDFDVSLFSNLEELIIGNDCFDNVNLFKIDGLKHLKSIKIGDNSCTKNKEGYGENATRSFSLMNCDELELIEIGRFSFSDYAGKFEVKNLPSLSSIKMGEIGRISYNFYYSSFAIEGRSDGSLDIQTFPIWCLFHWVMERSNFPQQLLLTVH